MSFWAFQALLFKIPFVRKIRNLPGEKFLRYFRFVILTIFVILLPLFIVDITGLGEPWFCKFICPAGTLEGGIPLVLLNKSLKNAVGFLLKWKLLILILTIVTSIIVYRSFCRYICPLGAIYGIFYKVSILRIQIDSEKCTKCGACQKKCKLDIKVFEKPDSTDCIRCGECFTACPSEAISMWKICKNSKKNFKKKSTIDNFIENSPQKC